MPTLGNIGVSVISLAPYSMGMDGPRRALDVALEAGLDGLQLMPLRGWTAQCLEEVSPEHVISYEGEWRKPGEKLDLASRVLFGNRAHARNRICYFQGKYPDALAIDLGPESLVETSAVNFKTEKEYLDHIPGVVLDLWHVREPSEVTGQMLTRSPMKFVHSLAREDKIKLIHFQTRDAHEYQEFLNRGSDGQELEKYLTWPFKTKPREEGTQTRTIDVIIELHPLWLLSHPVQKLRAIKERICTVIAREY